VPPIQVYLRLQVMHDMLPNRRLQTQVVIYDAILSLGANRLQIIKLTKKNSKSNDKAGCSTERGGIGGLAPRYDNK
jgi:hypothetical protein